MASVPLWPTAFLLPLGLCFYYFLLAGARTFRYGPESDLAAGIAQASFFSGLFGTVMLGFRASVPTANAIAAGALMLGALLLYEWARRTIRTRGFHVAWSGDVPESVCREGPYRLVRHPVYSAYILAFAAMVVALPMLATFAIFLANLALFAHAARDDERSLAESALAADYARYRAGAGMFLPRFGKGADR